VFLAVPAKRQMINIEKLPFPTGIAAATTLRTLHAKTTEGAGQARALGWAGLLGAAVGFLRDGDWKGRFYPLIPATFGTDWIKVGNFTASQLTMRFEARCCSWRAARSSVFRQAWSILLGACVNYLILAPRFSTMATSPHHRRSEHLALVAVDRRADDGHQRTAVVRVSTGRAVQRTFATLGTLFGGLRAAPTTAMNKIEVPSSWFNRGFVAVGAAVVFMGQHYMHIAWWNGHHRRAGHVLPRHRGVSRHR